ncbi:MULTISPECIES: cell wall-binding repeat-containing protein [unclassified Rathayibacter]|uniref:cell wall-binding repeat-containing protein n=1 Tax=unclassified Rathayibacter TaxID=2609250 RepID=UPI000F4CEAD5|nr:MULTISPECIES: cell wall-binding repeat-containing protein [unclassified Rathayibacter]ROP44071.1 putative cell wall-binding protein [Rathayibacter sp. PhB186]ROS46734.1 putative cell wall-binding protein [Rathayibacter sp. PhB185]
MSPAPRSRSRVRLLATAGAVLSLLAGAVAAGSPAQASAAGTIEVSGLLRPGSVDAATPDPTGEAYRVRAVDEAGAVVEEIVTDETYSLTLPAGGSYAVRAEVIDDDAWYPTWYAYNPFGGVYGSPFEREAQRFTGSNDSVDIQLAAAGTVSGTVTPAAAPGVTTTDFIVEAWYSSNAGDLVKLASLATSGTPGAEDRYSFSGADRLPTGVYVFRLAEADVPDYDDEYFQETARLDKYVYQSLEPEGLTGIDFTPTAYGSDVERVAGSDRYETATLVSRAGYVSQNSPMYIASGANWPDALSAGPAASLQRGSLLLTDPLVLPETVARQVEDLRPSRIVVVGSALSVSDAVLRSLDDLTDAPVVRIAGRDRYETSRRIVADAFRGSDYSTVFLATGTDFPDALSAAPIAGRRLEPVLLVDGARSDLDNATRNAIRRLSAESGQLLGGTPSISSGIESALRASTLVESVHRVAGTDRHDTSRLLNALYPPSELVDEAFVASATSFADALAAGPAAAERGAPLYLSETACLPGATKTAIARQDLDYVTILGGTPTLSAAVGRLRAC